MNARVVALFHEKLSRSKKSYGPAFPKAAGHRSRDEINTMLLVRPDVVQLLSANGNTVYVLYSRHIGYALHDRSVGMGVKYIWLEVN